jgi:MoxR-like ATPase
MLAVSKSTMKSRGIDSHGLHPLFGYALLVAESRIPMMLIGPAGTGKSHLTEQVSTYLSSEAYPDGFPYGEAPMSAGASRSDLLGRHTINAEKPFVTAEAIERYSKGGVFSFEEIDRGDPSVLIVLNNALARGILFNPVNGENYSQHPDFVPVATANTMGLGANREYGTAERLDGATLDRFRMGRIFLPLDEGLEEEILFGRI